MRFPTLPLITPIFFFTALAATSIQAQAQAEHYARIKADVQVIREDQRRLYAMIKNNEETLSQVTNRLQRLEARINDRSSNDAMTAQMNQSIASLRDAIQSESAARKKAVQTVVDQITGELEKLMQKLNSSASANRSGSSSNHGGQAWSGGVQGEYTVAAGDTLGRIAQAFGVSTSLLMKANNLDDDMIRIGQILIIPKP